MQCEFMQSMKFYMYSIWCFFFQSKATDIECISTFLVGTHKDYSSLRVVGSFSYYKEKMVICSCMVSHVLQTL